LAKALLRRHRIDRAWGDEVNAVRHDVALEERF
jgi:hypothetical protein